MDYQTTARVLVLDQDLHTTRLVAFMLRQQGYETQCVLDAEAAILMAESFRPDALVFDPKATSGVAGDLLRRLRALPGMAGLRVLTLSARDPFENSDFEIVAAANSHGRKPLGAATLLELMKGMGVPPSTCFVAEASP